MYTLFLWCGLVMQHKMCLVGVGNNNKRDPEHRVFFFLIISPKTVPTPKKRNHQGEGLAS